MAVVRSLRRPKAEVVFHTNWISALLTLLYTLATGEFFAAVIGTPCSTFSVKFRRCLR